MNELGRSSLGTPYLTKISKIYDTENDIQNGIRKAADIDNLLKKKEKETRENEMVR